MLNEKEAKGHPSENTGNKLSESEQEGNFTKRFKSHADSGSVVTGYFRKNKKMIIEEEQFKILENKAEDEKGD